MNTNHNNNQKGTDMKTFLVKFTGSNEWIEMQATSKFDLAERLRSEGKSGSIKSPQNMEETMKKATPTPSAALVKLEKLTPEEIAEITELLEKNILPHLKSDVSNYAKGRQRVWLPYEAPLGNQPFTAGLLDGEVWQWIVDRCAKHGFKAQVALISKGGNIKPHRDTTYAAAWAMGFNLGKCDWHIASDRQSAKPDFTMNLNGGEVFKFNSKHTHAVTNAAEDRWAINVWAIAETNAAAEANIAGRLEQMLEKHPEVQEFIELHQPGANTTKSKEDTTMKAEQPQNNNPVIKTDNEKETKVSDKPISVDKSPDTTNKTSKEGNKMIKEYLVETILLEDEQEAEFRRKDKLGIIAGFTSSVSRVITNDPEYWFKKEDTIVIEEVDRGGYHYALLEHIFGDKSFIVNITSWKNPLDGEQQRATMIKSGNKTGPTDSIFGWADFASETVIRIKDYGKRGWTDLSEFGLSVKNSDKMTKRLAELVRAARGYKINVKANKDRMLNILVLTYEDILKAFPHLENEFNAEKAFDGVSVMALEKAKDVYRNNSHISKRSMSKILNQMDNMEITNHTLRVLTNINGVAGEIKGNVLTSKRAMLNARLVELGLSDGSVSYDIVTSVDNFKKELGTDGTWEIITLEPHHGPGMVKTNDQTLAQFFGIKGIFDPKEILEAFQTVLDDIKQRIYDGKDIEWATLLRNERAVTESDKFRQLRRAETNKGLNKMYATLNDLGLDLGVSQTLMFMRANSIKKMFLSDTRTDGYGTTSPNWTAPASEKKSFLYMPWAYRAYVMTKEVIFMAGYDLDMQNTNCGYHKETQTFAMPGKQWAETCGKLGGADLDDEIMIHIRKVVELDGSERLAALLIRTPNDWAEFDIVDVKVPGPVFVNKLAIPTLNMKDLVKFNQTSAAGQLPSKVNGSNRPKPAVWDWASTRYNYNVSTHDNGGVGGQVKTKMLRYAIYDSPFMTLPCANEDMIDAIQQCKGDVEDLKLLAEWSGEEVAAILTGKAMDAYWWYSRNMYKTARALKIKDYTKNLEPGKSPIVKDLMVPRENMVNETFAEVFEFLKASIVEIEEIKDVFESNKQQMHFRKLVTDVMKTFFIPRGTNKAERSSILDKAAVNIMARVIAFEEANGEEATNMHILRMARASYLLKVDRKGANHDKWLYTVTPNSDTLMTDYLFRAMVWYREKKI